MRTIKRLKLKELRKEHGIAQGDIASKAGVSQAFLSAVESGRRPASDKLKQVLIDQFNIDNIEDYEIEVETDDVKGYSFANNGQYNDGQSGGQAIYYDMKGQPAPQLTQTIPSASSTPPSPHTTSPSASTLDVMTNVVKDYLDRNLELQRDKQHLQEELDEAKRRIQEMENTILTLNNKLLRLQKRQPH